MASKRGNGEDNIFHHHDGRWEAHLTLPDGRRKSFMSTMRQEAVSRLAEAIRDRDKGMRHVPGSQTSVRFLC